MPISISRGLCHQCSCPNSEPKPTPPPQETFQYLWVGLAQSSVESLLCAGSLCMSYLCASTGVESASLSPVELLYASPAVLQNQILWRLLPRSQTLRLGSLMWRLELSLLVRSSAIQPFFLFLKTLQSLLLKKETSRIHMLQCPQLTSVRGVCVRKRQCVCVCVCLCAYVNQRCFP